MFKVIREAIAAVSEEYNYNKYITHTVRPFERDTVALFWGVMQPVLAERAQAKKFSFECEKPSINILASDDLELTLKGKPFIGSPDIRRSLNIVSNTTVRMTFRSKEDKADIRHGLLTIQSGVFRGTQFELRVTAPAIQEEDRTAMEAAVLRVRRCLDYMLSQRRAEVADVCPILAPELCSKSDFINTYSFREGSPRGPGG